MRTSKFDPAAVLIAALVLTVGHAMAEIIDVYPSQEALVTFDLSFLPPGAVVSSAVIHTRVTAVYGDPASLGQLMAARVAETRGQPSIDIQHPGGC